MACVVANAVCVVSTLACFEQIDEIAQLQRRIDKYRRRNNQVQEEHREAKENWAKASEIKKSTAFGNAVRCNSPLLSSCCCCPSLVTRLHDLWNYRRGLKDFASFVRGAGTTEACLCLASGFEDVDGGMQLFGFSLVDL